MKTKLLNFIKHLALKIYIKIDDMQYSTHKEYTHDRVMAEFHY